MDKVIQKEIAVACLEKLDIYKPYITGFEKKGEVCWFENYGGFWASQDDELIQKKKELESRYNCTVYAITHEYTGFGELYSFLIVPEAKREWRYLLEEEDLTKGGRKTVTPVALGRRFYAFAYVWNKDDDLCSEFGTIGVQSFGGGLRRFA